MMKFRYYHPLVLLVFSLAIAQTIFAAPSDKATEVRNAIQTRLEEAQKGEYGENRQAIDAIIFSADPHLALVTIQSLEHDTNPRVRSETTAITAEIGRRSQLPDVRQQVVERLIKTYIDDEDSAVAYRAYKHLFSFGANDFNEQAKARIRQHLNPKGPSQDLTLLAGIANMTDQSPLFRSVRMKAANYDDLPIGEQKYFTDTLGWNARLALARMGSQEDIAYCIKMVEAYPDMDTRVTRLLYELSYIRQPEVIRVIQKYLERDGYTEAQFDVPPRDYWEFALNILVTTLEDFPVKDKNWSFSLEDRETARAWMNAQTEFKIKR